MDKKVCSKCKIEKTLEEFSIDLSTKSGRKSQCKECRKLISKKEYKSDPLSHNVRTSAYYKDNKESTRKQQRDYERKRLKVDPLFKLGKSMRCHLYRILQGQKSMSTKELLGYNVEELKIHIESLWVEGMNWENWGKEWEIDHIYPLSQYLKEGETRPSIINSLKNLQPISKIENRKKSNKL